MKNYHTHFSKPICTFSKKKKYRIPLHRFVCLIDLLLYVHGKQLRPCQDGQILNHTVPVQASQKWYVAPILLPVINNLLFSNQQRKNDDIGTVFRLNIDLNLILKLVTDCTASGGGGGGGGGGWGRLLVSCVPMCEQWTN